MKKVLEALGVGWQKPGGGGGRPLDKKPHADQLQVDKSCVDIGVSFIEMWSQGIKIA